MLACVSEQKAIINAPQSKALNKDLASRLNQTHTLLRSGLTFTPQDKPLG